MMIVSNNDEVEMPGIKDVARLAGVSVSTVSYVFSGKRSISPKTAEKVRQAVEKLGYIPNASAQRLRGGHNRIIAISEPIRDEMNQTQYNAYFLETAKQAKDAGYDVLILTSEEAVIDIQRVTGSNLVEGVILLDLMHKDQRAALAHLYSKPCVAIGYPTEHQDCACIDLDFTKMGRMAARILYRLGHQTIAFLRGEEEDYQRGAGYMILFYEALLKETKALGITLIESEQVDHHNFDADRFTHSIINGPAHPTALINQSGSDILNAVLDSMQNGGISIPDDCSVLSCGTLLEKELVHQPISEIPFTPDKLCTGAVSILRDAIENKRDIRGVVRLFKPNLVDRGSLANVRSRNEGGTI